MNTPSLRTLWLNQQRLAQFDATRDLRGTFYIREDWKERWKFINNELSEEFDTEFRDNGNSFSTCL